MSTDSQGRPLSDDGQWAWNGTEWVPAAGGPPAAEPAGSAPAQDVGATMIAPSPFAGGFPGGAPGAAPAASPQGYGDPQPGYGQAYGQQPGYGQQPAYPGAAPGGYGVPPQSKSRRPLIIGIIGVLVIAAVVVVLVVTLGGSSKKTASVSGAYSCTAPGQSGTGVITFKSGGKYTLDQGGSGGSFTTTASQVKFTTGDLANIAGNLSNGNQTLTLSFQGATLTCKK